VLQAKSPSYFLHYDDGSLPDGWEQGYSIRPRTGGSESGTASAKAGANGASGPSASAVQGGPRNGKYTIYAYSTYGRAMYDGYFVLNSGLYELFLPGVSPEATAGVVLTQILALCIGLAALSPILTGTAHRGLRLTAKTRRSVSAVTPLVGALEAKPSLGSRATRKLSRQVRDRYDSLP
jgi:hypothetical protein